jgi:hypothetical protein
MSITQIQTMNASFIGLLAGLGFSIPSSFSWRCQRRLDPEIDRPRNKLQLIHQPYGKIAVGSQLPPHNLNINGSSVVSSGRSTKRSAVSGRSKKEAAGWPGQAKKAASAIHEGLQGKSRRSCG